MTPAAELPERSRLSELAEEVLHGLDLTRAQAMALDAIREAITADVLLVFDVLSGHVVLAVEELERRLAELKGGHLALIDTLKAREVLGEEEAAMYVAAARQIAAGRAVDAVFRSSVTAELTGLRERLRTRRERGGA
jgi:hypothetical protein